MQNQAPPKPGRPKSDEKRAAILSAASDLFLERGLRGTSMDAVAKSAGVSKQTVYSHFRSKEELFRACIRAKIASYGFDEAGAPDAADAREALYQLARGFVELLFDPEVMAMSRVVQAETAGFPRIASLFYEAGPAAAKRTIVGFLRALEGRGELRVDDMDYASWLLANMAVGSFRVRLELGVIDHVPADELEAHLRRVADDFLVLFGTERAKPAD